MKTLTSSKSWALSALASYTAFSTARAMRNVIAGREISGKSDP
jgi:hypothetical protein